MDEERPFEARRILVAIDASEASLDALSAAATLAARLGSSLEGLFVEDEDLLRFAALPFADLVRTPGGARERIDSATAEASLRAVAAHAREALERAASRHRVPFSFRVVRGRVPREILSAAAGADVVVLGASSHGRAARSAMGTTARAALAGARASVLLLARGARLEGGIVALDDGTPAGARARAAARRLAPDERQPETIQAGGPGPLPALEAIARLAPALVILPAPAPPGEGDLPERLLAAGFAVLLVR